MLGKPLFPVIPLVLAAVAAPAVAQDSDAPGKMFALEAGNYELVELIDVAAGYLDWNILTNDQEIMNSAMGGSQVKLQNPVRTDTSGCEDLITTILVTKGFAVRVLDQSKQLYEVIALHGPRVRELFSSPPQKTPEQILSRANLRMPVATVVQLQHVNAIIATNSLRPFFAQGGSPTNSITIGNVGGAGSVLLSGMQDQVANAIRILREADVPQPGEQTVAISQQIESLKQRIAKLEKELAELKGK